MNDGKGLTLWDFNVAFFMEWDSIAPEDGDMFQRSFESWAGMMA